MFEEEFQGISFPERAESISSEMFSDYKVFLEHWDILSTEIKLLFEGMSLRGQTKAACIHGYQGTGKTLFSKRFFSDFEKAKSKIDSIDTENNLWHRITCGNTDSLELVKRSTQNTSILSIEDDPKWVETLIRWKEGNKGRHCIVVVDNAERAYFYQGLLGLELNAYLQMAQNSGIEKIAGQRFVALCRKELMGCLFLMLTNNDIFALQFEEEVNAQHQGLLKVYQLPFPTNNDKETVIRVNVNRLNPISYWYCLDKAGPEAKERIYSSINGASNYTDTFSAVDAALKGAPKSRVGRSSSKCTLTFIALANIETTGEYSSSEVGLVENEWKKDWFYYSVLDGNWATKLVENKRKASLLASEWNLRIIVLGNPFIRILLNQDGHVDYLKALFELIKTVHTPGTWTQTKEKYWAELHSLIDKLSPTQFDLNSFWSKGQMRSHDYESSLKKIFPSYNMTSQGFLSYRPDVVIEPYTPCAMFSAVNKTERGINSAIKRDAHTIEFTAIQDFKPDKILGYLKKKVGNYLDILEQ